VCAYMCASMVQGGSGFVPAGLGSNLSAGDAGYLRVTSRAGMELSKSMMPTEQLAPRLDLGGIIHHGLGKVEEVENSGLRGQRLLR